MHKYLYKLKYIHIYYIHPSSLSLSLIWYEGCRSVGAGKCDNEGGQFLGVGKEEECGAHSEYLQGMFGLRMYSCSLFEKFCPPKFPFLLWLKLLVCCTIE